MWNSNSLLCFIKDPEAVSVKSVFSRGINASHFFAVHIEILTVDLDAHDDDLIVPLSSDWCVPQLANTQGCVYSPNNLWRTNTSFHSTSLSCFVSHYIKLFNSTRYTVKKIYWPMFYKTILYYCIYLQKKCFWVILLMVRVHLNHLCQCKTQRRC